MIPAQRSLGTKYFTTEPVSVDCSTNSPCQHRSKYIQNNMENVYIDVRLEKKLMSSVELSGGKKENSQSSMLTVNILCFS